MPWEERATFTYVFVFVHLFLCEYFVRAPSVVLIDGLHKKQLCLTGSCFLYVVVVFGRVE